MGKKDMGLVRDLRNEISNLQLKLELEAEQRKKLTELLIDSKALSVDEFLRSFRHPTKNRVDCIKESNVINYHRELITYNSELICALLDHLNLEVEEVKAHKRLVKRKDKK